MRLVRLEAELESNAAPDQPGEHQNHRQVERTQDNRIGEGEGSQERRAAEDQPGLVAIPDGGDRIDHDVPICAIGNEGKQDADPEIESVHDDVHHQAENDDDHPHERKIDTHVLIPPSARRV